MLQLFRSGGKRGMEAQRPASLVHLLSARADQKRPPRRPRRRQQPANGVRALSPARERNAGNGMVRHSAGEGLEEHHAHACKPTYRGRHACRCQRMNQRNKRAAFASRHCEPFRQSPNYWVNELVKKASERSRTYPNSRERFESTVASYPQRGTPKARRTIHVGRTRPGGLDGSVREQPDERLAGESFQNPGASRNTK